MVSKNYTGYNPTSLADALDMLKNHALTPYAGGTDLMTQEYPGGEYLFLNRIPELRKCGIRNSEFGIIDSGCARFEGEYLHIGACCTFAELLECDLSPALLKQALQQIAGPAIRNEATIGGNIANGSPKADSALICVVSDSLLRLASANGERIIPISEFYLGGKRLTIQPDELLVEIIMPLKWMDNYYYHKVGARNSLAISRLSFAGLCTVQDGRIAHLATAFGAVSDVILRRPDIDGMLTGKTPAQAKAASKDYLQAWDEAIVPIHGRVSADYRKAVCMNLLRDFLERNALL